MRTWQVQDAKARFSEFLEASRKDGPQIVTRRGIEAAVLVRTLVLVWCIVLWIRREPEPLEIERRDRRGQHVTREVSVA